MKTFSFGTRRFLTLVAALLWIQIVAADDTAPAPTEMQSRDEVHRVLGILNYVMGDYPLAVNGEGEILNESEYLEQIALLEQVRAILVEVEHSSDTNGVTSEVTRGLLARLEALRQLVVARTAPSPVLEHVQSMRSALVEAYDLNLSPPGLPSLVRGRQLYGLACAACHGAVGRGRTPTAAQLDPRPPDLLARRLDQTLSPYQTFNVVTYGVEGTAMPSFPALDAAERWDIAFYVMAMRQRAVPRKGAPPLAPPLQFLARSTDAELSTWLADHGVPKERCASEVARLRRVRAEISGD